MSITIDIARLDESPHSSSAAEPVGCNDCHTGRERYLYPHQTNPAEARQEFAAEVSENCENCHYPHKPFHQDNDGNYDGEEPLPVCADCHGSHAIAGVDQISEQMPGNCLACHTQETMQWVDQYLAPRPGIGDGHEGYAGSARCAGCHEDVYFTWQDTLHARLIQNAIDHPDALVANFDTEQVGDLPFTKDDIAYTIGSRWRQAYLSHPPTQPVTIAQPVTRTVLMTGTVTISGNTPALASTTTSTESVATALSLLPMQWLVDSQTWAPLEEGGEFPEDWITECGSCHVTGLDTETWSFTEFGIGCESCHGPAEEHARDPENVKPFAQVDDQVCGSCHSRGTSSDGYHFPASYRPGEPLAEHFTFTTEEEFFWPDGSAKDNHQQYMDWILGNSMAASGKVGCTTCHSVHDTGETGSQLREPLNDLCLQCHNAQRALVQHTPFHQQAMRMHNFQCTDCHMPKIVSNGSQQTGAQFDHHSHAFLQPDPSATIEHGGIEFMPNSCNLCHDQIAEDPTWAQETINFSRETATSTSFFGPGPTPTSPPPPTPVASVGQAPEEIEIQPPLGWLRAAVFATIGLIVVFGAAALVNSAVSRRKPNA